MFLLLFFDNDDGIVGRIVWNLRRIPIDFFARHATAFHHDSLLPAYMYVHKLVAADGYETEIIGANERFSSFMGLDVRKKQMIVFAMTGMIAGLGGAVEILGNYGRFMVNFASGLGFDGIVVSLLANGNPIGIIFAALFMGAMTSGSIAVEMFGGVPKAMTGILLGVIIMIITVKFVPDFQKRKKSKKKENKPC